MKVYLILFDMMILYYIIRTNKSTHGTYNSKTKISKGKKNKKKRNETKKKRSEIILHGIKNCYKKIFDNLYSRAILFPTFCV